MRTAYRHRCRCNRWRHTTIHEIAIHFEHRWCEFGFDRGRFVDGFGQNGTEWQQIAVVRIDGVFGAGFHVHHVAALGVGYAIERAGEHIVVFGKELLQIQR